MKTQLSNPASRKDMRILWVLVTIVVTVLAFWGYMFLTEFGLVDVHQKTCEQIAATKGESIERTVFPLGNANNNGKVYALHVVDWGKATFGTYFWAYHDTKKCIGERKVVVEFGSVTNGKFTPEILDKLTYLVEALVPRQNPAIFDFEEVIQKAIADRYVVQSDKQQGDTIVYKQQLPNDPEPTDKGYTYPIKLNDKDFTHSYVNFRFNTKSGKWELVTPEE